MKTLELGKGMRTIQLGADGKSDESANAFTARYNAIDAAVKTLNAEDFKTEAMGECVKAHPLNADVFGIIVMQHLPMVDANMTVADKTFWLAVADELGPDWVESFRRTAAFMAKVGGF